MSIAMDIVDTMDLDKHSPAVISFYTAPVQKFEPDPSQFGVSRPKLTADGVPTYQDVNYVTVRQAGGVDSVIFEAERWIKQIVPSEIINKRMSPTHAEYYKKAYARFLEGLEVPVEGTSIKQWPAITPAQVALLISLNIRTIEELATLPDDGMRRIGMGGVDLKNKAKTWLAAGKDKGKITEEMTAIKKQNELLELNLKAMADQVEEMKQMMKPKPQVGDGVTAERSKK